MKTVIAGDLQPGWDVVDDRANGRGVNVLPASTVYPPTGHTMGPGCACRPRLVRRGPLDEPFVSHREPSHAGSVDRADA